MGSLERTRIVKITRLRIHMINQVDDRHVRALKISSRKQLFPDAPCFSGYSPVLSQGGRILGSFGHDRSDDYITILISCDIMV